MKKEYCSKSNFDLNVFLISISASFFSILGVITNFLSTAFLFLDIDPSYTNPFTTTSSAGDVILQSKEEIIQTQQAAMGPIGGPVGNPQMGQGQEPIGGAPTALEQPPDTSTAPGAGTGLGNIANTFNG
jgi:hypothetical protein